MINLLPQIYHTVRVVGCEVSATGHFHMHTHTWMCDANKEDSKTNGLQNKFSFNRKKKERAYFQVLGFSF